MSLAIDIRHEGSASKPEHIKPGAIPVQRKASSRAVVFNSPQHFSVPSLIGFAPSSSAFWLV